jgi:hypothetical protein
MFRTRSQSVHTAVNNARAGLVVLLLRAPEVLEGRERGENRTTDPHRVLALGRGDDLDLHAARRERRELLLHAVRDTREHGGSTREDDVAVEVATDVEVALEDRVVGSLVDTSGLETDERRLEEGLGGTETKWRHVRIDDQTLIMNTKTRNLPLVANGDDLSVRKLVALLEGRGLNRSLELLLKVEGDVAELLLDVTDDFTLGGGGEGVPTLHQVLDEELGQVTAGKVETGDGVRERETLVDGHGVGDTITGVENDTGGTAGRVKREDGLDGDVERRGVEGLEHDLRHLLTVGLRVERGLGEEDRVLLRSHTELVVEGVMPDLLHVVPVGDDTVLDRVLEGQDTTLGLGLITKSIQSDPRLGNRCNTYPT